MGGLIFSGTASSPPTMYSAVGDRVTYLTLLVGDAASYFCWNRFKFPPTIYSAVGDKVTHLIRLLRVTSAYCGIVTGVLLRIFVCVFWNSCKSPPTMYSAVGEVVTYLILVCRCIHSANTSALIARGSNFEPLANKASKERARD